MNRPLMTTAEVVESYFDARERMLTPGQNPEIARRSMETCCLAIERMRRDGMPHVPGTREEGRRLARALLNQEG